METAASDENAAAVAHGSISREDPRPLHRQVHGAILAAIEEGRLPRSGKLPSERELVDIFGVSRITIRHAMRDLVQQGFLQSQPGKGFYVVEGHQGFELHLLKSFTNTALANNRRPGQRLLDARIYRAPLEITRPLFLPPGAEVFVLSRLRLLDDVPVVIQTDWLSAARVPGLIDLDWTSDNRSLYAELRERFHIRPVRGQTTLSARLVTEREADLLDLVPPAAVLTVDQIAFDGRNRPVNMTMLAHHPERYPLTLAQSETGDIEQI
ncbi:GntR family transcriptional regulator [Kaistia dalseonensis]|uniref:GntR family transcriptional regulator n=1 Tax=Kaistia dalseonensis TaxID=410840 RepID=A0ABU0HCK8_9HYPH|nr:GntR family transcriptional regulator [Kaistia dalseonensis]MCX5496621.1 GntR family transcriptional regulator [Kaistia dalseonensis]MDQ0439244.1 GntR family transcriptional regulator [Kaistia dalseonensis]